MMFDVRFSYKRWPGFRFHIMWTLLLFSGFALPARTQHNISLLVAKFSTITTELMPRPVAMIRHLWDDNRVVFAGKTAVYGINLSSRSKRLIAGGAVQGYSEGVSAIAKFMAITDIVSGPDLIQQTILVSDYGAGCIRQVNLITQLTRQIFGKCSTNPGYEDPRQDDPSNYVRVTAIAQDPNKPNVYYIGERRFIRQLHQLRNGGWEIQSLGLSFYFVLEKTALLWNYNIVYIVGTNSIWMTSSSQRIDILASDSSWDGTRMRLSSAIIHQNRWLVATDRSYEIFRVFDMRTNATFSLCNQFGGKSCALRNPVAIINHPLKLNSYLVAGNELYEVEFKDADEVSVEKNRNRTTNVARTSAATAGTTSNIARDNTWANLLGIAIYSFIGSVIVGFIGTGIYTFYVYRKRKQMTKEREKYRTRLSRYRTSLKS